jgi:hypothetical protein
MNDGSFKNGSFENSFCNNMETCNIESCEVGHITVRCEINNIDGVGIVKEYVKVGTAPICRRTLYHIVRHTNSIFENSLDIPSTTNSECFDSKHSELIQTILPSSNKIPDSECECESTDISIESETEHDNRYLHITAIHINALCVHEIERYVVWVGKSESDMDCYVLYKKDGHYICDDDPVVFDPIDGAEHENMITLINMF